PLGGGFLDFLAEDLVAYFGDLSCSRWRCADAAFHAWAASAAWTDDSSGLLQRLLDPGDVEHIGYRSDCLQRRMGNARLPMVLQTLGKDRFDQFRAAEGVGVECRGQIDADRQHVLVSGHVTYSVRVTAVEQRAIPVTQHRNLRP